MVGRHHHHTSALYGVPITHSHGVLAFHTGGRSRVEQNGEWSLKAGDVLLVPAGEPHRTLATEGSESWGLSFCVPCLAADGTAALKVPSANEVPASKLRNCTVEPGARAISVKCHPA